MFLKYLNQGVIKSGRFLRNYVLTYYLLQSLLHLSRRIHCMKSVQMRSFFWSVFSRIRTEYGEIRTYCSVLSPNVGKYGPEKLRI